MTPLVPNASLGLKGRDPAFCQRRSLACLRLGHLWRSVRCAGSTWLWHGYWLSFARGALLQRHRSPYLFARISVAAVNATGQAEALGISLCDRRLGSYSLSYFEALEFGMLQIEWPRRIVAGARVRSAELLRFGPCLEGGLALPHCMGGIERNDLRPRVL
jgi:hypothetical protein